MQLHNNSKIPDKYPWFELNMRARYETLECEVITQPDINSKKFRSCENLTVNYTNSVTRTFGYTNNKLNYNCLKPIDDTLLNIPILRRSDGRLSSIWLEPLKRMTSCPS